MTTKTTQPARIQRSRTAGWRMPEGSAYVGRPSRWGNPFAVNKTYEGDWSVSDSTGALGSRLLPTQAEAIAWAVELFYLHTGVLGAYEFDRDELRLALGGKDLACWCPLDQPCHADVLLYLANN